MPPSSSVTQIQLTAWPDSWSRASFRPADRGPRQLTPDRSGCPSSPQWGTVHGTQQFQGPVQRNLLPVSPAAPSPTSGITLCLALASGHLLRPPLPLLISERCPLSRRATHKHTFHSLLRLHLSPNLCPSRPHNPAAPKSGSR